MAWNLTSEILRREYDFTQRYEFHHRKASTFRNGLLGSFYVAKQIEERHDLSYIGSHPYCLDNNEKGDLIVVGFKKKSIKIINWRDDKTVHNFKSNHEGAIIHIKFINDSNIISSDTCGQIRRTAISPDRFTSAMIYKNIKYPGLLNNRCHATPWPRSDDVVVIVTSCGKIFFKDLRCPKNEYGPKTQIDDSFEYVAHHPLAPEICVAGDKTALLLFDTRKLSESSVKASLRNIPFYIIRTHRCEYSYNGSEILASSVAGGVHILNQGELNISAHKFSADVYFMGPRSDTILSLDQNSFNFCHKSGKRHERRHHLWTYENELEPYDDTIVKPHSYLPFLAAANSEGLTRVWSAELPGSYWDTIYSNGIYFCNESNVWRQCGDLYQRPFDLNRP